MDRSKIERKNKLLQAELDSNKTRLLSRLKRLDLLHYGTKSSDIYDEFLEEEFRSIESMLVLYLMKQLAEHEFAVCEKLRETVSDLKGLCADCEQIKNEIAHNEICKDTKIIHLKGDIIITDPSYITKTGMDKCNGPIPKRPDIGDDLHAEYYRYLMNKPVDEDILKRISEYVANMKEWAMKYEDDWFAFDGDFTQLGFENYIMHDTLYGDWSCTTFNKDTKEPIGEFCADTGMVGVFLLEEVLRYNPDFNYHLEKPWTTTWIKDFDGDVQIQIIGDEKDRGVSNAEVIVTGTGTVNFIGIQTDF